MTQHRVYRRVEFRVRTYQGAAEFESGLNLNPMGGWSLHSWRMRKSDDGRRTEYHVVFCRDVVEREEVKDERAD